MAQLKIDSKDIDKLSSKQIVCEELKNFLRGRGLKIGKEHKFNKNRKWRFDILISEKENIAIEVDGGIYTRIEPFPCYQCKAIQTVKGFKGTGHTHPTGFKADQEKRNAATMAGWRILYYTTDLFKKAEGYIKVLEDIKACQK